MAVEFKHPRRPRRGMPTAVPHGHCRACDEIAPMSTLRTIDGSVADLDTVLRGRWMCIDESACLSRYTARSRGDVMFAVILLAEEWASGSAMLFTANPRRAHEHAARMGACVVPMRIHTDYRK